MAELLQILESMSAGKIALIIVALMAINQLWRGKAVSTKADATEALANAIATMSNNALEQATSINNHNDRAMARHDAAMEQTKAQTTAMLAMGSQFTNIVPGIERIVLAVTQMDSAIAANTATVKSASEKVATTMTNWDEVLAEVRAMREQLRSLAETVTQSAATVTQMNNTVTEQTRMIEPRLAIVEAHVLRESQTMATVVVERKPNEKPEIIHGGDAGSIVAKPSQPDAGAGSDAGSDSPPAVDDNAGKRRGDAIPR